MCSSAAYTLLLMIKLYIEMKIAMTRNVTECEARASYLNSSLCYTAGLNLLWNARSMAGVREK